MVGFLAAAAPALVSAAASIFGAKKARKQALRDQAAQRARELADQQTQFSRLREAAVAGGFNPLTVLRATGGGGFLPSVGGSLPTIGEGIMASASFLGDALTAGMNWKTDQAARGLALESAALQNDLARVQLGQARGMTGAGWSVPVYENKTGPVRFSGPGLGSPGAARAAPLGWPAPGGFSSTFTDATQGFGALISDTLGMSDRNASLGTGENMDPRQRRGQDALIDFGRFVYDDVILGFGAKVQDWRDFSGRAGAYIRDSRARDGRAGLSETYRRALKGPAVAGTSAFDYFPGNQAYGFPQLSLPDVSWPDGAGFSMGRGSSPAADRVSKAWRAWRDSKGY